MYFVSLYIAAADDNFYPYGALVGDKSHVHVDDACNVTYSKQFSMFGNAYNNIYVSVVHPKSKFSKYLLKLISQLTEFAVCPPTRRKQRYIWYI